MFFYLQNALVTFSQHFYGNNNQKQYSKITNLHKKLVSLCGFYCENVLKWRLEFGENSEKDFVCYIGGYFYDIKSDFTEYHRWY